MTVRSVFLQSPAFFLENNIFYQRDFRRFNDFETLYFSLRKKENRVYTDEMVMKLPEVPPEHPLTNEWRARKFSSQNLLRYLTTKKNNPKILEVGCGNGWLSHKLASIPNSEVTGVDINETELLQAGRVFSDKDNLFFAYADILKGPLPYTEFDYIILSASIQYFPDIEALMEKLLGSLERNGELHIIDSPVYGERDVLAAKERSKAYFSRAGFPSLSQYYYHHTWRLFENLQVTTLYRPKSIFNWIRGRFYIISPFPWIKIVSKK